MTSTDNDLPKPVQRMWESACAALEQLDNPPAPKLEQANREWVVVVDNGRVRATAPFRKGFDGKWKPKNGGLSIDGAWQAPVHRWSELVQILQDHPAE